MCMIRYFSLFSNFTCISLNLNVTSNDTVNFCPDFFKDVLCHFFMYLVGALHLLLQQLMREQTHTAPKIKQVRSIVIK